MEEEQSSFCEQKTDNPHFRHKLSVILPATQKIYKRELSADGRSPRKKGDEPVGKRTNDHRTRVSRLLIRRAFMQLLRKKSIQSISVTELCETAGLNRSTFYAHYTDVDDLLRQIEDEMQAEFEQALAPLLADQGTPFNPVEISAAIFRCLKDNADLCTVTLSDYGDKGFLLRLLSMGRERCMETYLRHYPGVAPRQIEYFYAFASAGCIGLLRKWLDDGMTASAQEIAQTAEALMLHGLGMLNRPPQPLGGAGKKR